MSTHTILVVEDERPLANAIVAKLQHDSLDVVTARTAEQALNHLNEGVKVDAIWLDHYLLGKETGLALLSRLKNNEKWKSIPVFVVSNTATPEKRQSYIEFGINEYFVKSDHRLEEIVGFIKQSLDPKE